MNENNSDHFVMSVNYVVIISLSWVLFQYAQSGNKQNLHILRFMGNNKWICCSNEKLIRITVIKN